MRRNWKKGITEFFRSADRLEIKFQHLGVKQSSIQQEKAMGTNRVIAAFAINALAGLGVGASLTQMAGTSLSYEHNTLRARPPCDRHRRRCALRRRNDRRGGIFYGRRRPDLMDTGFHRTCLVEPVVARVGPFHARKLAVAADGTIWAVGNRVPNDPTPGVDPNNGALRHYDAMGKFLASFFPTSSLDDRTRVSNGSIAVSSDREGWMSWGSNTGKVVGRNYIEILFSDNSTHEYPAPQMEYEDGPIGFTDSGAVVANVVTVRRTGAQPRAGALMTLNHTESVWEPLPVPGLPSLDGLYFAGVSGNTLARGT